MTFLPIVARELGVAARKRSTFWLRVVAALVAVVIGSGCLMLTKAGLFGMSSIGRVLFGALTWISVAAALSAGLFFTSDCLSEEKREGTLGFLFLTDLRGYDVAGGKLLATSIRGFYALLAILPILAVTLLMGGVAGAQFWKTSLTLLNAMFCSLAAGLFVSAISRDSQKALAATLFLLLLFIFGGPLGDAILAVMKKGSFSPVLSLSSPGYVFRIAGSWGRTNYWIGLLVTQVIAWLLFGLACALIPRTWQEKAATPSGSDTGRAYAWKYGGARRRMKLRSKLVSHNPVLWLACRERWQSLGLWTITILAGVGFALLASFPLPQGAWMAWSYIGSFCTLVLYLLVASQACRFFVEARRSGLTELLLVAPLEEKQIVRGQWRALLRMFGLPILLLLGLNLTASVFSQISMQRMASSITTASSVSPVTNAGITSTTGSNSGTTTVTTSTNTVVVVSPGLRVSGPLKYTNPIGPIFTAIAASVSAAANLVALCWFGMWMGMTSKSNNLATLKTIIFVQIIPWFVISFGSMMGAALVIMPRLFKNGLASTNQTSTWVNQMMAWFPFVIAALATIMSLAKDAGFIIWSRRRLYFSFREQASRTLGPAQFVARSFLSPPIPPPPVIAAQP